MNRLSTTYRVTMAGLLLLAGAGAAQAEADYENAPILYGKTAETNRITWLQQQLDAGTLKLDYHPDRGYLDSLLKKLSENLLKR